MKILIVYCSNYRSNTARIAEAMATKVGGKAMPLAAVSDSSMDPGEYDLIGIGSGVYRESMSKKLFRAVEAWDLQEQNVFVFSTSGVGMKFYNNRLIRLLRTKRAKVMGSFACKGSFDAREFSDKKVFHWMGKQAQGHPDAKDIRDAESFAGQVLASVKS
ncbi:flavodoxin [Alkalibacter rhizosphaerae]|uniref:Flavodoxin n=1 Tax=Alkalibacter rhizosphaerae TaxID=2815577 RepID=A0A974XPK0_9FIRM|nr:flavodoxin [Alkalibacter rhizosphaerae]